MAPSDEALTWQRRADDWAQQAEVEPYGGGGQAIEPANRWSSEVSTTGRPTFPADGVGWRTETAEWRATGARWRQTTEWRSATGSHVWRSTTEAWQDEQEAALKKEQPAISGTAWPTPGSDTDDDGPANPSWRQSSTSWDQPSWRQSEPTPRQADPVTPSWQAEPETPSWRRGDPDTSSSWRSRADGPAATTPVEQTWSGSTSWQQPSGPTPSWQQSSGPADQAPSWQQPSTPAASWQQPSTRTPSWQEPQTPARQEPPAPSWQQPSAAAPSWQQPQQTPSWQQPAPSQPTGPSRSRRRADDTGSWGGAQSAGGSWSDRSDQQGPGENTGGLTRWERTDAPGWQRSPADDARHLVREDDREAWRRDAGYSDRPTRVGRRRAAESGAAPSGGSGWSSGPEADNWAGHEDTGSITPFADPDTGAEAATWSTRSEAPSRRDRRRNAEEARPETPRPDPAGPDQTGRRAGRPGQRRPRYNANTTNWREDTASWDAEQDTSNWTRDPDTGQWSRAEDDPRVLAWRAEAARREAMRSAQGDGDEDTGRRARRDEPAGGVPGGPLPSSSVPAGIDTSGWTAGGAPAGGSSPGSRPRSALPSDEMTPRSAPPGSRPRSAPAGAGMSPGPQPRSAMPASAAGMPGPIDEGPGRRRRADEPYGAGSGNGYGDYNGGRRRAAEAGPGPDDMGGPPAPEAWQSRQNRRSSVEPDSYQPDGYQPGNYPPGGGRPGPRPPQWADPSEPQPRRSGYRDEPPVDGPTWQDGAGYGGPGRDGPPGNGTGWGEPGYGQQPAPEQRPPRSGFGSAARALPAGPAPQQRSGYGGGPARELPAGPSAPQRSPYGGAARALPAGPSAYATPAGDGPDSGSWIDQERQQPAPQRPAYGDPAGEQSWLDQERRQAPQRPGGDPAWIEQERRQAPRPGGDPSWIEQQRHQQAPQRPMYGGPGTESSWLDQERQQPSQPSGPSYGSARPGPPQPPGGGPRWPDPAEPGRPAYGAARALPAGSAAPASAPAWSDRQPPAPASGPAWADRQPSAPASGPAWTDRRPATPASGPAWADRQPSAPASGPAWTDQQKPAYGGSGDLSERWPDPLTEQQSGRRGYGDPPPAAGGFGDRPPLADWLAAERAGRRGADYRGAGQDGETDWRRELSRQSDLAEGESRRYDTSDFPPFRPSGSASVDGSSNLALSATSVISTAPDATAPRTAGAEEDTSWPPRRTTGAFQGTGSYERRPVGGDLFAGRSSDLLDPDDDEEQEQPGSPLAAVGYTVVWYGVPVVLFVLGMFLLNSGQRTHALDTLADAAPEFAISLVLSMMVAYGLRSATTAWKSASVGLAAAVVGGGLATVLSSAITGNSLS